MSDYPLYEPWIGSVTDGRRDVVEIHDQHGRTVFVHVESILLECEQHASADDARAWAEKVLDEDGCP